MLNYILYLWKVQFQKFNVEELIIKFTSIERQFYRTSQKMFLVLMSQKLKWEQVSFIAFIKLVKV